MPAVPKDAPNVDQQSGFGAFFKPADPDIHGFWCPARRFWYPGGPNNTGAVEPCGEEKFPNGTLKGGGCTNLVQDIEGSPGQWGDGGDGGPNHWIASAPRYRMEYQSSCILSFLTNGFDYNVPPSPYKLSWSQSNYTLKQPLSLALMSKNLVFPLTDLVFEQPKEAAQASVGFAWLKVGIWPKMEPYTVVKYTGTDGTEKDVKNTAPSQKSFTFFLNTPNFQGPAAMVIPGFWDGVKLWAGSTFPPGSQHELTEKRWQEVIDWPGYLNMNASQQGVAFVNEIQARQAWLGFNSLGRFVKLVVPSWKWLLGQSAEQSVRGSTLSVAKDMRTYAQGDIESAVVQAWNTPPGSIGSPGDFFSSPPLLSSMPFGDGQGPGVDCDGGFCRHCGDIKNTWSSHAYYPSENAPGGAQGAASYTGAVAPWTYELTAVTSNDGCAANVPDCTCALELDWKSDINKDSFRQYYDFSNAETLPNDPSTPGPPYNCSTYKYTEGAAPTKYTFEWCDGCKDPTAGQCADKGKCGMCQKLSGPSSDSVPSEADGGPPGDWQPFEFRQDTVRLSTERTPSDPCSVTGLAPFPAGGCCVEKGAPSKCSQTTTDQYSCEKDISSGSALAWCADSPTTTYMTGQLEDGSYLQYFWVRFRDQPAVRNAMANYYSEVSLQERGRILDSLQETITNMHAKTTSSSSSGVFSTVPQIGSGPTGTLRVASAQLVQPPADHVCTKDPKGNGERCDGWVPIAVAQCSTKLPSGNCVDKTT